MLMEIKNRWIGKVIFSADCENMCEALKKAIKDNICLSEANLSEANLSGANLSGANLSGVNLYGANLSEANLSEANLSKANLPEANLSGANLSEANLSEANLSEANLSKANLSEANLSEANLSEANLSKANLSGVKGINTYIATPLKSILLQPFPVYFYKLVTVNYEGPFNGGIKYQVGSKYEIVNANTDNNVQCAVGINLATLDWCIKKWEKGCKILQAKIKNPEDIAAIPINSDGKFRVFRCEIVKEMDLKELGFKKRKEDLAKLNTPEVRAAKQKFLANKPK